MAIMCFSQNSCGTSSRGTSPAGMPPMSVISRSAMVSASSRYRQERLLAGVQLHVDGGQQCGGAGVVSHQQHEIDELVRAKQRLGLRESSRGHLVIAPDLAAEVDDRGVGRIEAIGAFTKLDDVDDVCLDAFLQG